MISLCCHSREGGNPVIIPLLLQGTQPLRQYPFCHPEFTSGFAVYFSPPTETKQDEL
jgi:hypothetical protein